MEFRFDFAAFKSMISAGWIKIDDGFDVAHIYY